MFSLLLWFLQFSTYIFILPYNYYLIYILPYWYISWFHQFIIEYFFLVHFPIFFPHSCVYTYNIFFIWSYVFPFHVFSHLSVFQGFLKNNLLPWWWYLFPFRERSIFFPHCEFVTTFRRQFSSSSFDPTRIISCRFFLLNAVFVSVNSRTFIFSKYF